MAQHTIQSLAINRAHVHMNHLMYQNQFKPFFRPSDTPSNSDDTIHATMTVVLGRVAADVGIVPTGNVEAARTHQPTSEIELIILPKLLFEKILGDINVTNFHNHHPMRRVQD